MPSTSPFHATPADIRPRPRTIARTLTQSRGPRRASGKVRAARAAQLNLQHSGSLTSAS